MTKDVQNRLILISNDDGLKAKGLKCLINIAKEFGRVLVVAPDTEKSGMSHSVTLHEPIYLNKISSRENLTIYACSGTPVDCVKIALHKILKYKTDLISFQVLIMGNQMAFQVKVAILFPGKPG